MKSARRPTPNVVATTSAPRATSRRGSVMDERFAEAVERLRENLTELLARDVAAEAAVLMLLKAEAARNPDLPDAMRIKFDEVLGQMLVLSDPTVAVRARAAFQNLLAPAVEAAETDCAQPETAVHLVALWGPRVKA